MPQAINARALSAIGAALLLFYGAGAQGAPIFPGGAFLTPGEVDIGGTVKATETQPFSTPAGPGHYSGTLTSTVYVDDPSNPFANIGDSNPLHHGLTFVYQVHNDATSVTSLERMTNIDFSNAHTNVSYAVPAAGLAPTSIDRSGGVGTILGWDFTGAPLGLGRLAPGQTSAFLVVHTDSPLSVPTTANLIDGAVTEVNTYGPDSTFIGPEPGSLGLLAVAAIGMRRRERC